MTGRIMQYLAILVCAVCVVPVPASAATITTEVSADRITLNDRLELTISITGPDARKAGVPQLKTMPGFAVVGTSTSTEYQFINGKSSILVAYIYTLTPRSVGVHDVGAATVTIDGKSFSTEPRKVEVVAGTAQPQAQTGDVKVTGGSGDADLFIRTNVDNREPYVGEQVTLTFELYNRLPIWGDTEYDPPSTTGFWAVDLPKITPSTQNANNRVYKYNAVKTALFPTTSGPLTIGPAKLTYTTGGFFTAPQTKTLATKPITVRAKPLPDVGKPVDFSGAVGQYKISASMDKETARAGDVVTVKVTVSGEGNLDMLTSLSTPDLSAFKTYDPKVTSKALNSGFTIGGEKVWEYVLVPKFSGTVTIKPFVVTFFNPKSGKYQSASTAPIELKVTPGDVSAAENTTPGGERNTVETIANDIRFIKPDLQLLENRDRQLIKNPLFYLSYVVSLALFATAFVFKRRRDAIERDTGLRRKLAAWKNTQRLFDLAEQDLSRNETAAFCGHLSEALVKFIGDRLTIDTGALTCGAIEDCLKQRGVDPVLAEKIRKTLELADFVRFSSSAAGRDVQDKLLADAREIVQTLRETI